MHELKIFLKYLFSFKEFTKSFKEEIKKTFHPRILSFILLGVAGYCLIKLKNESLAGGFLFLAILAYLRLLYVGGEHKRWYRQNLGIKTKNEIQELKSKVIEKDLEVEEVKEEEIGDKI